MALPTNLSTPAPPPHPARCLLAPPIGAHGLLKDILWNETELRAGWRLLIYFLIFAVLGSIGVGLAMVLHLPQPNRNSITAESLLVQDGIFLFSALVAAWTMSWLEARPLGAYGLPARQTVRGRFWQGVLWGMAMIAAIMLMIWLFDGFSPGALALRGQAIFGYAILWSVAFLCVGLFEEFLFRGYTQFTLTTGVGFWQAATLLSASFGAVHLANGGEGPVGALSVFVIGMFFCLTLRRTGNLWFAVGTHAAFDWGETFLFSVPDSGVVAPGHLLNSSFHGPTWLTGGTVGPEGSVMAFAVVAATACIFSRVYPALEDSNPE